MENWSWGSDSNRPNAGLCPCLECSPLPNRSATPALTGFIISLLRKSNLDLKGTFPTEQYFEMRYILFCATKPRMRPPSESYSTFDLKRAPCCEGIIGEKLFWRLYGNFLLGLGSRFRNTRNLSLIHI